MKKVFLYSLLSVFTTLCLPNAAFANNVEYEFSSSKQAITKLKGLPGSVDKVLSTINGTNFGPFNISGSCGYDHQWYCLGMACKTFSWSWKFPSYVWLKNDLKSKYDNIQRTGNSFDKSFSPVKNWLVSTLPSFSNNFNSEADKMMAAVNTYNSPKSSSSDKAKAKSDIVSSIENINHQLQSGVNQINSGISSLSGFNQRMNSALRSIDNTRNSLNGVVSRDEKQLNDKLAGYPCDAGSARSQYNGIKKNVLNQFNMVTHSASSYGITSNETDKSVSLILGTVLNIQNGYKGVLTNLKNASITPTGAVQALRVNVAKGQWTDLAEFAKKEFE